MSNARERRVHTSLLAALEKRCLVWMAERMPARINSDHLTALAGVAMLFVGGCYWVAPAAPIALVAVVVLLAVNWFGDSLDGTLARVRGHERPRYGFYVDHVLDSLGMLFLVAGLALGGFMSPPIAAGLLIAYYLLMIEIALATHTVGTFRISYWGFGPTELRILLAIGTLQLLRSPEIAVLGTRLLLFDVGGGAAILGLSATLIASIVSNTTLLYRMEPLPGNEDAENPPQEPGPTSRRLRAVISSAR
ncbi:MAG TPA: CDP-alcohol phosphatidyltransferase family protein [Vicinamibacterales bacterium]|nr:CDP-alcohol phosphatidyltransferase family protein [Vicinamibacterales bacterium]